MKNEVIEMRERIVKKRIALGTLALAVFVTGISINTKAESLKLSEKQIEYYPSQRHIVVISSASPIDKERIQIKNKDIYVKNEGCEQTDVDYACLLSFSGFKPTEEKVEIKYGNQVFYVDTKVKSFDDVKPNMSLDEQFEIAQAKLLTQYHVISSDDIKDEKVRLKVEDELEKLADKYTDPKDKIEIKGETYKKGESPEVGHVMLTKNAQTSGFIYGHAGIHGKLERDIIEIRGFGKKVRSYPEAENEWKTYKVKTGIWTVKGATKAQRLKATGWAWLQSGKPYSLNPNGTKTFFCTKLVWMAWESQKKKIGHYWLATEMMGSKALKLKKLYHK